MKKLNDSFPHSKYVFLERFHIKVGHMFSNSICLLNVLFCFVSQVEIIEDSIV